MQYGLKALLATAITPEEFVTLNEKIGGTDIDSNLTTARSVADTAALTIAYQSGIVSNGKNLDKPAAAVDFCFLSADIGFTTPITDQAVCDADAKLAVFASPHQVAGNPKTENILKCTLKPLVIADYTGITFTVGQQTRLNTVFATGVCDWSEVGVGQVDPISPLTFQAGPGGVPLPAAPTSTPI